MQRYCTIFLLLSFLPFAGCVRHQNTVAMDKSTSDRNHLTITVKKVKQLLENESNFILIDSRSRDEYAQSHLPTAVSLPACEGNKNTPLPGEKDQLHIFYCGWPACDINTHKSILAAYPDYPNIHFMKNGIEGWIEGDLPTVATDNFVQKGHCILIDLRAAHKNTVQRIPGSVSIPFPVLTKQLDGLSKKAVIVVYSDHVRESHDALADLRSTGFTRISMVDGNFQGWKHRGRAVTSGPVKTSVTWKEKPVPGHVTLVEFNNALHGRIDAILLDVRTMEEVTKGKLPRTIHIPLEELTNRKNELPRDKKIFIHCSTGPRADMASRILRKNGYTSFALGATLECKNGNCELLN